jgi:cytoskeletal protein RodZ
MIKLGSLLYQQRIQKHLTLEEVEKETKIKASFLSALEKGEYHKLPSLAYAKGFIQNYGTYLGLSKSEVMALFRREVNEQKTIKVLPSALTDPRNHFFNRIKIQESLVILGIILMLFAGYLLFHYRTVFFAPSLTVDTPKQETVTGKNVIIAGSADQEATVTINNEQVSLDEKGHFTKTITLFPGRAEITIKAHNQFGKETTITREIVVK